jgi:hypothetical protein
MKENIQQAKIIETAALENEEKLTLKNKFLLNSTRNCLLALKRLLFYLLNSPVFFFTK